MITAVGAVVPARDEADHIGPCLAGVARALAALPGQVETAIWVMVDRCTDGTADLVRRHLAGRVRAGWEVSGRDRPVGALRDRGVRAVLGLLDGHRPRDVWLLNTDADSSVPAGWAADHVALADAGADAVAGLADLAGDGRLHPVAAARYRELIAGLRHGTHHDHVYGANLGVRASAYLQVGGFAPLACGEDVDLVDRLRRAGFEVAAPLHIRVRTSARTSGRVSGGLADLLAGLEPGPAPA